MTTLIQYLQRVLIVAIPAILVFLCFTPYRMKALSAMNLRTSHRHEAGLILFVTSIFGILALTLWPTYIWMDSPGVWGDIRILIDRPSWKSNLSLIPFTVFKDYIEDLFKTPVFFFATLINFFGNLAIFVPIGFFPALLFRDANWKRSAIIVIIFDVLTKAQDKTQKTDLFQLHILFPLLLRLRRGKKILHILTHGSIVLFFPLGFLQFSF